MITLKEKLLILNHDVQSYNENIESILKYVYKNYKSFNEIDSEDPILKNISDCNERFKGVMKESLAVQSVVENRRTHLMLIKKVYKVTDRIINVIRNNQKSFALNFCLKRAMKCAGYEIPKLISEVEVIIKREENENKIGKNKVCSK